MGPTGDDAAPKRAARVPASCTREECLAVLCVTLVVGAGLALTGGLIMLSDERTAALWADPVPLRCRMLACDGPSCSAFTVLDTPCAYTVYALVPADFDARCARRAQPRC